MSKSITVTCRPLFGQPYIIVTLSDSLLVVCHLQSKNVLLRWPLKSVWLREKFKMKYTKTICKVQVELV